MQLFFFGKHVQNETFEKMMKIMMTDKYSMEFVHIGVLLSLPHVCTGKVIIREELFLLNFADAFVSLMRYGKERFKW